MSNSVFDYLPKGLLLVLGSDFKIPNDEDAIYGQAHNLVIDAENKFMEATSLSQEEVDEEREEALEYMCSLVMFLTPDFEDSRELFIRKFGDFYLPDNNDNEEDDKLYFEKFCSEISDFWSDDNKEMFNENGLNSLNDVIKYVIESIEWEHPSTLVEQFLYND